MTQLELLWWEMRHLRPSAKLTQQESNLGTLEFDPSQCLFWRGELPPDKGRPPNFRPEILNCVDPCDVNGSQR